ncbi:CaiB/BaiF CoA transferase family protein [Candidimonas nitroreducens]|uniref:CoA transferase n=1 Tax=Candidimonas nitroreducens TaxID=683354 RepID=A0A225M0S1_9BURK|nr:CoA transferase [Candidimonas nitroreducens]OWT54776.1 CoA transferase [Candidimonas nitroreducens]
MNASSSRGKPSKLKTEDYRPAPPGALDGVRVLDLSRLFAGNSLTQTLADFGAEVVKVEPHDGDTLRAWRTAGVETNWKLYSRNKKSVAIRFRDPRARDLLLGLAKKADVFVESFRPGTLEQMGLAPETLLQANPRLIVVRISGWGQEGPYRRRPGFGTLIEGISGFASMNGFADREPVLPPMYLADAFAGSYGATAVLIALRSIEMGGGAGQVIDLPLLDPLFHVLGPQAANYRLSGEVKQRVGSRSTNSGPRNVYLARDGRYVSLSASTQKMAERVFRSIGRADLVSNPRYATNALRVQYAAELDAIIGEFIAQRTQAENVAFFEAAEVTIGPVYDISQVLEDEHFIEREILADYPDEEMGAFPMHHVVPRLSRTPGSIRTPAPRLGEHNRQVLAEIGIDAAQYQDLLDSGVVVEDQAAS